MIWEWVWEWVFTVVDNCWLYSILMIKNNICGFVRAPGSGGSRPGTLVRLTCDFSGRAMVRVLGHRCSIVVWDFWSPYFRVKAAWLKFSSFDKFDNLFETAIRSPSFLDYSIIWLPAFGSWLLLGTTRLPLESLWQVVWCPLEPSTHRLPITWWISLLCFIRNTFRGYQLFPKAWFSGG